MTKNAKARNGATEVKAPEVKENNVDPALVKEIDKELGVLADAGLIAGTGEQPHVGLIVEPGKPVEETDHRVGRPLGELLYAEESGGSPWQQGKSLAGFDRGGQEGRRKSLRSIWTFRFRLVGVGIPSVARNTRIGRSARPGFSRTSRPIRLTPCSIPWSTMAKVPEPEAGRREPRTATANYIVWRKA